MDNTEKKHSLYWAGFAFSFGLMFAVLLPEANDGWTFLAILIGSALWACGSWCSAGGIVGLMFVSIMEKLG